MENVFLDILNKHAPLTNIKIKGICLPFVTSEIESLIRQRDYLRAKANKTGSNILRQAFVQIKNKVNYKLALLRKNYYSRKIEQNKGNLRNTWKILKQAMGQGNKTNTLDNIFHNNQEISEDNEKAKVCNEHFIAVGQKLAEDIPSTDESPTANITPTKTKFKFGYITVAQIENVIKRLINNKATGMNGIPNKILKDNSTYLSPFFEECFNLSIETNTFPDDFKIGKVAPVFKSGDKEDLNNYRPISVLPTIARIFERLLYNQLYDYLTVNKLLGDEQYGFRSLHSTAMALGKMSNQWLMDMDNGNLSAVVFLDIRKAFDTVDHTILLQELSCYGIQGDSVKRLESYLTNRMQCCSVNGHISPLEIIKCGVPQGSILGPLLFIVYMNDLP